MPTVSYGIANTADDVVDAGGVFDGAVAAGFSGGLNYYAGLRFLAVAVPQGATVSVATLFLNKDAASSTAGPWGSLKGVAADNVSSWSTTSPATASRTTASTTIFDGATQAVDVTAQVQEIVNRGGWASGNALGFASDPTGAAGIMAWVDYAASAANAAQLSITYSTGPDVTAPTITSPATASVIETDAFSQTLTANETVTWTKTGGADAALFSLSGSTLSLPSQLYLSPADADANNTYIVQITATDTAGNATDQTVTVTVTQAPLIRFIAAASGTTAATMPAHRSGDVILAFAFRDGSATLPTLPTGQNWTSLLAPTGANTASMRAAGKIAASSSEAAGTFTSATTLDVSVYRCRPGYALSLGAAASAAGATASVSYPALTLQDAGGNSIVVGWVGHRSVNTTLESPPTGMVNRQSTVDATDETALHDTNGGVSAWSLQTKAVGGTASGWFGATVEIKVASTVTGANPASASQIQTATSPTLAGKSAAAPVSATQSQAPTSPAVTAGAVAAAPASSTMGQAATSPTLASMAVVSPQVAAQAQAATSASLAAVFSVQPNASAHAQATTSPTLISRSFVAPESAAQAQSSTSPGIATSGAVQPAPATQGSASTSPAITSRSMVAPDMASQTQAAGSPVITSAGAVSPAASSHAQVATQPAIQARASISVQSAASIQIAGSPFIAAASSVFPAGTVQGNVATQPTIQAYAGIVAYSAFSVQVASSPSLIARASLSVDDATQQQFADQPLLASRQTITIDGGVQVQIATSAMLNIPTFVDTPPSRRVIVPFRSRSVSMVAASRSVSVPFISRTVRVA